MAKSKERIEAEREAIAQMKNEGWDEAAPEHTERLVQSAHDWMKHNKRKEKKKERVVTMRLDEDLIAMSQHRADQDGLAGYQSLIKSVLYRYLTGRLVDPETAELRRKVKA